MVKGSVICNLPLYSVTITNSIVYLGTSVLGGNSIYSFFSSLTNPGVELKSQNDPVVIGYLIRCNSLASMLI